jgi:hypothetical protein
VPRRARRACPCADAAGSIRRICSPTGNTGFSDVIGSWKIIAISAPRMSRSIAASAAARSTLVPPGRANAMRPETMRPPPCSTSRITDSAVTDFPEPDSPTTAIVSPSAM